MRRSGYFADSVLQTSIDTRSRFPLGGPDPERPLRDGTAIVVAMAAVAMMIAGAVTLAGRGVSRADADRGTAGRDVVVPFVWADAADHAIRARAKRPGSSQG